MGEQAPPCPGYGEPCGYTPQADGPQFCPVHGPISRAVPTTCIEHAYGSAVRLSFQIKVF